MSYCVNCGVELDKTATKCPLCKTEVINPKCPPDRTAATPYPMEKGTVDPVSRKGLSIFLSVVLAAIAFACFALNLFLFNSNLWSPYVMGACLLLWIFSVPPMLLNPPVLLTIVLDGAAICFYLLVIAFQFESRDWYYELAVPIVVAATFFVFWYAYLLKRFKMSIFARLAFLFGEVAGINLVIELAIRHMVEGVFYIRWSAVVLTCCGIVVIALVTVARHSQLREQVRRRMHL